MASAHFNEAKTRKEKDEQKGWRCEVEKSNENQSR